MSVFRTAYVYVRGVFAGTLSETDKGYSFAYGPASRIVSKKMCKNATLADGY